MPVRPRRRAASSSMRPFDATVTCSSVPALGPDPASQVSHNLFFPPKEPPSVVQPRPGYQTSSSWLLPCSASHLPGPLFPCFFSSPLLSLLGLAASPFTPSLIRLLGSQFALNLFSWTVGFHFFFFNACCRKTTVQPGC